MKHAFYLSAAACGATIKEVDGQMVDVIVEDLNEVDCLACWHWIMDYSVLRIDGIERERGQTVEKPPPPERAYVRAVPLNIDESDSHGRNSMHETWIDRGRQGRIGPLATGIWALSIDEGNVRVRQTGEPMAELDESDMMLAPQTVSVYVDRHERYIHLLCPKA